MKVKAKVKATYIGKSKIKKGKAPAVEGSSDIEKTHLL